jgi:hypothetical protein
MNLTATALMRIHRTVNAPIFYNRQSTSNSPCRFDAPADEYGVLYAAPTFSACMFETLIRGRFEGGHLPLLIDEHLLASRSVAQLGLATARPLRLADFTQSLAPLGGNAAVLSTPDYAISQAWSLAVHDHPGHFDGLYFRSRYSGEPCVALFDRAGIVLRGQSVPLMDEPLLGRFLDTYQVGIC